MIGFVASDVGGQPLIETGDFVLGYPNQGNPTGRAVPLWMFNGSFLVIERIAQDVPGWWAQAEKLAADLQVTPETIGAALVGRWRDGTPVALDPNGDPRSGPDQSTANGFDYSDDPNGINTQLFAHIRKVNPRNGTVLAATLFAHEPAAFGVHGSAGLHEHGGPLAASVSTISRG